MMMMRRRRRRLKKEGKGKTGERSKIGGHCWKIASKFLKTSLSLPLILVAFPSFFLLPLFSSCPPSLLVQTHSKGVTGISLHPTGDYVLSASADKSWAFSDLHSGKAVSSAAGDAALGCIQWHPDGIIFGAGTADR